MSSDAEKLRSEELAALVIDALLHANILRADNATRAIQIAAEEFEARKAIGDY